MKIKSLFKFLRLVFSVILFIINFFIAPFTLRVLLQNNLSLARKTKAYQAFFYLLPDQWYYSLFILISIILLSFFESFIIFAFINIFIKYYKAKKEYKDYKKDKEEKFIF